MAVLHVVALSLRPDRPGGALAEVMAGLGDLVGTIEGFEGFESGPNLDLEGKSPDHAHGFVCRFRDRAALDRYAADPGHRALGARLVALCRGGPEGIVVYDFEVAE